jgi:hypothetical protein
LGAADHARCDDQHKDTVALLAGPLALMRYSLYQDACETRVVGSAA